MNGDDCACPRPENTEVVFRKADTRDAELPTKPVAEAGIAGIKIRVFPPMQ